MLSLNGFQPRIRRVQTELSYSLPHPSSFWLNNYQVRFVSTLKETTPPFALQPTPLP